MDGDPVQIRTNHRYGFRSGQWAQLLTTAPAPDGRDCYLVRFPDGETDFWVVADPDGEYELRDDAIAATAPAPLPPQ